MHAHTHRYFHHHNEQCLKSPPNLLSARSQNTASSFLSLVSNHCNFIAKPHSAGFYHPLRSWGWGSEKKRRKRGKKPTTADLNVALIKMACTRGEEYEPRNVLFLSFPPFFPLMSFWSLFLLLSLLLSHLSIFYFPSLSSPFLVFFMSPLSPPPHFTFLPLSIFFPFLGSRGAVFMYKSYNRERFAAGQGGKQGYSTEMKKIDK